MTHDILQSDIELAVRLRAEQRSDEEILQMLAHRGIDPAKAAQLLDDLHHGRDVSAAAPVPSEFAPRRRTRSERHTKEEPVAAGAPEREHHSAHTSRSTGRPGSKLFPKLFLCLVGVAALAVAIVYYWRYRTPIPISADTAGTGAKPDAALMASQAAATAGPNASATSLALELHPDGLHIGGNLVTRDNLLAAVAAVLGAPSRTNAMTGTGTTIFAYDPQGVLVYVHSGGKTNSLMLDCDATGGANGTTSAFTGTLKLEDQVIGPDTDAKALASLKRLGLSSIKSDGSIWGGRYNRVGLVFAYLNTPRRLSLIGIDLE